MTLRYSCRNCGADVRANDKFCGSCGKDLSQVGRAIKLEIRETLSLLEPKAVSQALSGTLSVVASNMTTTGSLLDAIPEEKRGAVGIDEKFVAEFKELQEKVQSLQVKQPSVDFRGSVINAPIYVAQGNDNIVFSLNIDDSFNKWEQEIDKSDIDTKLKALAKSKAGELRAEIIKLEPSISTVKKIYAELKTLVPLAVSIAQLGAIIGKFLVGGS